MAHSLKPFLMFEGVAEEAIGFYISVFKNSDVLHLERYGPGETGTEGTVKMARFVLNGLEFMSIDSPVAHNFTFTPALSVFVECEDEEELAEVYARLADGGTTLMPLDNYGFSRRFGWVNDRFGVSWQLNLA